MAKTQQTPATSAAEQAAATGQIPADRASGSARGAETSENPRETTPASDRKLRILMACDTFYPDINGAARFAERLSAGLAARGHDLHIAAPSTSRKRIGTFTETIEGADMTVHRLASVRMRAHEWLRFVWPWTIKSKARRVLDRVQPDVIHVQSHIVIGRGFAKIAQQRGIPIVATNHVMPENIVDLWSLPKFLRKLVVRWGWRDADSVLRRANAVTTPTRRAADFLERNTTRRDVIPVSCGIDASQYSPDLSERTEKRIVFVGRMTQEKHVDVIIRALAGLDKTIQLDLVGPGDQVPNLQKLAAELGVADRVVFHGRASDETLRGVLRAGSIFAIASIAELQSIATMEAMASGLPILAANAMALPHLVQEGENGYLFEPGDSEQLARLAGQILALDHADFVRMQKASIAGVQVHDINRTLDVFTGLYLGERPE